MKTKIPNKIFLFLIIIIIISSNIVLAEERDDGYYTIKDKETDEKIFATARYVHIGDEYLNEDNKLYRITEIKEDIGYAELIEVIDLKKYLPVTKNENDIEVLAAKNKKISVYHTHGAESYVPTDGAESIDSGGGIIQVGKTFCETLREKNIEVIHSTETHIPHDNAAYMRSRRTAKELLQKGVDAQFDVHRDAIPPEEYTATVNGEKVAQTRLVVGRQNPNKSANDNFAKQLKSVGDRLYPGLIKGIFYAKGSYNQDMAPRTILVEIGTHENDRPMAERGASLFANVVTKTVYGEDELKSSGPMGTGEPIKGETSAFLKAIVWIVLLTALGVGGYMIITGKSWADIKDRLSKFVNKEFADLFNNREKGDKE
ncbi:MAG TPA: stage II sporulation protein P [Thermoanaerobacterales bacterium]|nr:stage II sporulation protein P [Thermoanaerobacterales bacterium]